MLTSLLSVAIALFLTVAGIVAVLAIADSVIKAQRAYAKLMREAALLKSGFASQIEARDMRAPRSSARITPARRPALQRQPLLACVAA